MGQEAGESVKQLNSNDELLFDSAPEEDLESFDGVSRVEELENLLSEIVDYWDEDILFAEPEYAPQIANLMDHIGLVLANDPEKYTD